jgi:hypothetical protein
MLPPKPGELLLQLLDFPLCRSNALLKGLVVVASDMEDSRKATSSFFSQGVQSRVNSLGEGVKPLDYLHQQVCLRLSTMPVAISILLRSHESPLRL